MTADLRPDPSATFLGHTNVVSALCITGGRLYSASKDATIKEWDLESGEHLRTFVGHGRWVRAICSGAGRIFSGSWDDTVREWDLESGECVRVFEGAHELGINAVCVDEESGRLYSGSDDRSIAVYDLASGETIDTWAGFGAGSISSLVIIRDPNISVINQQTGQPQGLLISAASDGSVCLWDMSSGHSLENGAASTNEVTALALVGGRLYSAGNDKTVHEWDVASWNTTRSFRGHSGYVSSLTGTVGSGSTDPYQPDSLDHNGDVVSGIEPPGGPRIFSGSWDGTVRIWDLITGQCVGVLSAHDKAVNALVLGDNGKLYTSSADGTIKSWDLASLPRSTYGTAKVPLPSVEHVTSPSPSYRLPPSQNQHSYYSPPQTFTPYGAPAQGYYGAPAGPTGNMGRGAGRGSGGPTSTGGSAPKVCHFFQRGDCRFGDGCRNLHVIEGANAAAPGAGGFGGQHAWEQSR